MDNPYVHGLRQHDARPRTPIVVPNHLQSALTRRKIMFESMLLEERAMHEHSANTTGGYDAGAVNVNPVQSYVVNSNNANLTLPGNADQFNFTVNQAVTSFNLQIVGFGTFSLLNNYDVNNFANCYLSAYNLNNISITYNPVYVTASETLSSNDQFFTIFYTNTGSVLLSIFKSDAVEPTPTPTPTNTPTVTPTPTITRTPTPTPTPIPAIPGIDTNYVQDIYLTNSDNPGMNGVWTNVSQDFGFPAWVNYSYSSYAYIFAPNNGYSGGETWTFYDTDQGEPSQPSNPSTNPGSIPTSGWTQNVSISAHTWRIADNNYLVTGLTYDDGASYYSYPANGISIKRTPLQGATLYGDNGTFIFYTAANGGTFTLLQQIPYEESSFIGTLATKTGSPSARGIPAYGYTIGNPAQQYVTGSLVIEPIRFIPLSAQSIIISGVNFDESPVISEYFYDSQPLNQNSTPPFYYWGGAGDDHAFLLFNNTNNPKRWEMGVYYGNSYNNFAYNYASSVSGIPLSGWVITQDQISDVTGYPGITRV